MWLLDNGEHVNVFLNDWKMILNSYVAPQIKMLCQRESADRIMEIPAVYSKSLQSVT